MIKRICLLAGTAVLALSLVIWIFSPDEAVSGGKIRTEADLNGNGIMEEYLLSDHCLTVTEGEKTLWQSPEEWSVDQFVIGDADNDGTVDLAMSLWKSGSFGEVKPFWLTGKDTSYKNHLFLYKLAGDTLKSVWCSSDLDCPIVSFEIRDTDSDGLNELAVLEGQYRTTSREMYTLDTDTPVRSTVWQWEEWGFSRIM